MYWEKLGVNSHDIDCVIITKENLNNTKFSSTILMKHCNLPFMSAAR